MTDAVLSPRILRWRVQDPEVQERMCLVEVRRGDDGRLLVFLAVVLPRETRLRRQDLPQVADSVWTLLGLADEDPGTVRWFLRHGEFSTYDPTDSETLSEVSLHRDADGGWTHDADGERLVSRAEQAQLLAGTVPVEAAMATLK